MRWLAAGDFPGPQSSQAPANVLGSRVTHILMCQPRHDRNWHLLFQSHSLSWVGLILSPIIPDRVNILPSPASESPQRYTFPRQAARSAWFPWPPSPCRCPECNIGARLPAGSRVPRNSGPARPVCLPAHLFPISAVPHSFCRACRPGAWGLC